jgi:hypothetical protein
MMAEKQKEDKMEPKRFVTGFGQFDTRKNTDQPYDTITFAKIAAMAENPAAKPKAESQWVILSTYNAPDARSHDRQRIDGQFYALAIDIDEGNHTLQSIESAIRHILRDVARIIYSTSGSSEDNKKWRVLIPLKTPLTGWQYADAQRALFDLMLSWDRIICDYALSRPGQPIYLPNIPMDRRNAAAIPFFYESQVRRADVLDYFGSEIERQVQCNIETDLKREQAALDAAKARAAERAARGFDDDGSVVDAFNERHDVEQLLTLYGYARHGQSDMWRSRYQSSGSYATKSFGEYWVSLSASDAGAAIGTVKDSYCWGDAFDLFCHYQHQGDFRAAVRAYGQEINPSNPTAAQVLKPLMGSWDGPPINQAPASDPEPEGGPILTTASQIKQHRVFDLEGAKPVLASSYLIKGWLGKSQMSVVYGPSNVGKSFFCLDLAFSIAANEAWKGCKVRGGTVLYLATEGGNAFRNRVFALKQAKGVDRAPLVVRPSPIDLLRAEVDMPALAELCKEITQVYGKIEMIVVDTLSRAMAGGNENGPEDMTRFIGNLDVLRDLTGAHIMVVHHSGKDTAAGARGHSSLRAATDTEIELEVSDTGLRIAKTTKQRDMEPKPPLGFTLAVHELGQDEDGDTVTTCTIEIASDEDVAEASSKKPLGAVQRKVIECFNLLRYDGKGGGNPSGPGFPDPNEFWVIQYDDVLEMFRGKSTHERPKKQFDQALEGLQKASEIVLNGGFLWIPKSSGRMR